MPWKSRWAPPPLQSRRASAVGCFPMPFDAFPLGFPGIVQPPRRAATGPAAGGAPPVLVVDDDPTVLERLRAWLAPLGLPVLRCESGPPYEALARRASVLCLAVADEPGSTALLDWLAVDPELPVIALSNPQPMSADGAYDTLDKPLEERDAIRAILRAVERRQLTRRLRILHEQLSDLPAQEQSVTSVVPLRELERRAILRAIEVTDGNVSMAARLLGIGRATVYRRLAEMGERASAPLRPTLKGPSGSRATAAASTLLGSTNRMNDTEVASGPATHRPAPDSAIVF